MPGYVGQTLTDVLSALQMNSPTNTFFQHHSRVCMLFWEFQNTLLTLMICSWLSIHGGMMLLGSYIGLTTEFGFDNKDKVSTSCSYPSNNELWHVHVS